MSKLEGKTAVVIGGSSGMGLATAKLFVQEGAYVFITGRRETELDKAKAAIGRNVATVQGDLAALDDLDRLFATVKAEKGGLDTLVVSAGYGGLASISVVTPEIFDKTFDVNVRGVFFAVQKAIPMLRDGGTITFIGSGVHLKGIPYYITYGATKAAVRSLTRSLAVELKDRGIRVNTLSPGAIETPMLTGQFSTPEALEAALGMFKQMAPLGRIGRPEEMATAVLFLASSDSSYCTGIDLVSDGGTTQVWYGEGERHAQQKICFVTGSSATARDPKSLTDLIDRHGNAVLALPLDVTDRDAVLKTVAQAHRHFGRLDVILSNAEYGFTGAIEAAAVDDVRQNFETNVFETLSVVRQRCRCCATGRQRIRAVALDQQ